MLPKSLRRLRRVRLRTCSDGWLCAGAALAVKVVQRCLNGILGQDGTMDLDRREVQFLHDVRVLNLGRFLKRLAL